VPARPGGQQPAHERGQHGREQRRPRDPCDGPQQIAPVRGAQDDELPDRDHHGPAEALKDPRGHQCREAAAGSAQEGGEREDDNGCAEHPPGPESAGEPAAHGDERGHRDEVDGHREADLGAADAEIGRDARRRGDEDRAVEVLHEQHGGHEQREPAAPCAGGPVVRGTSPGAVARTDRHGTGQRPKGSRGSTADSSQVRRIQPWWGSSLISHSRTRPGPAMTLR